MEGEPLVILLPLFWSKATPNSFYKIIKNTYVDSLQIKHSINLSGQRIDM